MMIEHSSTSKAQTYYCRKYNWTTPQFQAVNWDAISMSMSKCNPSTSKWVTKFTCGFIGTAKTLARRDYWLGEKCPLCNNAAEDNLHVIICPSIPHREQTNRYLTDIYDWMDHISIPLDFLEEIKRITSLWLDHPDLLGVTSPIQCLQNQLELGWNHFVFGRTHNSIPVELQDRFRLRKNPRNAQTTVSQLICRFWTSLIRPLWNRRNRIVHALDVETNRTRVQMDLQEEVTERYNSTNPDLLAYEDRQLFTLSLDALNAKNQAFQKSWCNSVDIAVKSSSTAITIQDPSQRILSPLPHNPPNVHPVDESILTPVQRRIHRHRQKLPPTLTGPIPRSTAQHTSSPPRPPPISTPPPPIPPPPPDTVINTHTPRPQRQHRQRRHTIATSRTRSENANNTNTRSDPHPPSSTPRSTLLHYWSSDRERSRLMQGSWRPP